MDSKDVDVVGRKIVAVRAMTDDEWENEGWDKDRFNPGCVLVLDDGTCLYPSRDTEGNGPGAIFGSHGEYNFILFPAEK